MADDQSNLQKRMSARADKRNNQIKAETGPGEYWDSRFWNVPSKRARLLRRREPVRLFKGVAGVIVQDDGALFSSAVDGRSRLTVEIVAQMLNVEVTKLNSWLRGALEYMRGQAKGGHAQMRIRAALREIAPFTGQLRKAVREQRWPIKRVALTSSIGLTSDGQFFLIDETAGTSSREPQATRTPINEAQAAARLGMEVSEFSSWLKQYTEGREKLQENKRRRRKKGTGKKNPISLWRMFVPIGRYNVEDT